MGGEGHVSPVGFGRGATHQDTAQTINYGGVTINFHMPKEGSNDVKLIASEVRRILSDSSIREKAIMK
jgi:hypothetical protein